VCLEYLLHQFHAGHSRHMHVGNDPSVRVLAMREQKTLGRLECLETISSRPKQAAERDADGGVVVDDEEVSLRVAQVAPHSRCV